MKAHQKSIGAPASWQIKRKKHTFTIRPRPGAHTFEKSMPIGTILKELLKYAKTTKEVKHMLSHGDVLVNQKKRNDLKATAGLMDVVSFPKINTAYRIMINKRGKIQLVQVSKEEAGSTLARVENKKIIGKNIFQINLSQGRNLLVDAEKQKNYRTGDTILLKLPEQKEEKHLAFKRGATAFLISGKNTGKTGKIKEIAKKAIKIETDEGEIQALKKSVFIIGEEKPLIKTPID